MVIKAPSKGRLPRDIRVERGMQAVNRHEHPWNYKALVKSGTAAMQEIVVTAYNYTDMVGQLIRKAARRGENLYISDVVRTNRYRSIIRDY